jgi:hypothetical protein
LQSADWTHHHHKVGSKPLFELGISHTSSSRWQEPAAAGATASLINEMITNRRNCLPFQAVSLTLSIYGIVASRFIFRIGQLAYGYLVELSFVAGRLTVPSRTVLTTGSPAYP